jgi:Protein of unknown function (DUF3995)
MSGSMIGSMIGSMSTSTSMIDAIAIGTAAILLALAGLHVYWLSGRPWPGHDAASLNAMVVGARPGAAMPPRPMTAAVSAGIVGIALGALAARGFVAPPFPGVVRALTWFAAGVLAVRGLGGFFDRWLRPHTVALPFAQLNVRIYSPLALALAAGLTAALLG